MYATVDVSGDAPATAARKPNRDCSNERSFMTVVLSGDGAV